MEKPVTYASTDIQNLINWPQFLSRQDLLWDRLQTSWREAPFLGNGRLALSMFKEAKQNVLRFAVDDDDIFDRRDGSGLVRLQPRPLSRG